MSIRSSCISNCRLTTLCDGLGRRGIASCPSSQSLWSRELQGVSMMHSLRQFVSVVWDALCAFRDCEAPNERRKQGQGGHDRMWFDQNSKREPSAWGGTSESECVSESDYWFESLFTNNLCHSRFRYRICL